MEKHLLTYNLNLLLYKVNPWLNFLYIEILMLFLLFCEILTGFYNFPLPFSSLQTQSYIPLISSFKITHILNELNLMQLVMPLKELQLMVFSSGKSHLKSKSFEIPVTSGPQLLLVQRREAYISCFFASTLSSRLYILLSHYLTGIRTYFFESLTYTKDQLSHPAPMTEQLLKSASFCLKIAIVRLVGPQPIGHCKNP